MFVGAGQQIFDPLLAWRMPDSATIRATHARDTHSRHNYAHTALTTNMQRACKVRATNVVGLTVGGDDQNAGKWDEIW